MTDNLHEYKASEEEQVYRTIDTLHRDISILYDSYKKWKRKYAGLFDRAEQYFTVTRFYEELLSNLKDSKKGMKKVYDGAREAEKKLVRKLEYSKNRVQVLNLRIEGLCDMISNNKHCFESPDFDEQLKKVEKTAFWEEYAALMQMYMEDEKWKDLLSKDTSLLSDAEYLALATIYLSLGISDMEEFIQLCYRENPLMELKFTLFCFEPDTEKIQKLNQSMAALVSFNYLCLQEAGKRYNNIPDEIRTDRRDMLQKAGMLQALPHTGAVFGLGGVPDIKIYEDAASSLVVEYNKYNKKEDNGKNLVVVTRPNEGVANANRATSELEQEFALKYGLAADIEIATGAVAGTAREKIIEKSVEKGAELLTAKGLSKAIGIAPVAGDAISMVIDIGIDYAKLQEDRKYSEYIIDKQTAANYAATFELSCVYIDFTDDTTGWVYIEPTANTQSIIDNYEKCVSGYNYEQISISDVLYRSDYIFELTEKIRVENIDLYNDIFSVRHKQEEEEWI